MNEFKAIYEKDGLGAAVALVQEKVNELHNTELHIAVTGESGAGKSSFINAMRGLQSIDQGAAISGITETTMEPASYSHPNLPSVCFWDLPGLGTLNFQADMYLQKMNFNKYDFFIIISGCRFRENDVKLAKEIKRLGKKFYFVRTKIDNDIRALKLEGRKFNTKEELDKVRDYCVSNLEKAGISTSAIFLISNFKINKFDFPALKEAFENDLDDIKKHVFLLSLQNTTMEIIEKKRNELKKQIWMLAILSGAVGAVPVPGLSFACDLGILAKTIIDFRKHMGLDDASLQRLADKTGKHMENLKEVVKTPWLGEIRKEFVKTALLSSRYAAISAAEVALDWMPVIGSIFGAVSSFAVTYKFLNDVLDDLTDNAKRVAKAAFGID
ncbi:interferon-inducible GTPase 5-like [Scyliorhinus canicula]|uniref:interferon-inducible GTPase 5-like n=1 Tax=Scyliorhinus canicula TaxID=7830 RepID=UPI0018F71665|nr:interferon-inducible GTPase 5-like [Scyliorhinus canicula]